MDTMNISICKQHNKSFKFLCNDCNHLICSRCIGQSHCGHKCIHVDDIKINLSQQNIFTDLKSINDKYNQNKNSNNDNDINNDNNNNNDNENNNNDNNNNKNPNYMISTVESLLESINNIKSAIAPIQEKENTIVDHFKEIYNFLMSEESRLKKPLTDAIDTLNDQIKINNKEIESLLSVVMCYQQLLNSSEENEIKSASTSYFEDKVYQSLVETFSQLDLNTSTELVSKDMEQIVKQYNHIGLDFILLELLQRQRSKVQNRKLDIKELIDISNKKKDYKVFINNQSLQKLKQSLKESISVSNGKVLLISSNIEKGATIYDLSQSDIKLVVGNMNIGFECKSKSIFSSNEYIYFFDGKSYIKFSILNHIVNQKDQKEGIIEEMNYENVEYFNLFKDNKGIVYYFLVAADNSTKIIIGEFNLPYMSLNDPFFIIDRNTEYFIGDINFIGDQGLFFTFKEKIYVVTSLYIHSYCLESKIRETFRFIYQSNIISICNDDHGNIYYIYEEKNKLYFKKYNVITRGIIEYTISFPLSKSCPLLYHSDRLFLICGPDMNYIFDIRTTEWCKFDSDGLDRWGCGAIIVELK